MNIVVQEQDRDNDQKHFDDAKTLSSRDKSINGYREIENIAKFNIIKGMIKSKENYKHNKKLLAVYLKYKQLFDGIIDEHTNQIKYLQNIIKHLDAVLNDYISSNNSKKQEKKHNAMIKSIHNDKQKIGRLIIRMRKVLNTLNEIDSIAEITPDIINKYTPDDFNIESSSSKLPDNEDSDIENELLIIVNKDGLRENDDSSESSESSESSDTSDSD
jgi:hypothetical protein